MPSGTSDSSSGSSSDASNTASGTVQPIEDIGIAADAPTENPKLINELSGSPHPSPSPEYERSFSPDLSGYWREGHPSSSMTLAPDVKDAGNLDSLNDSITEQDLRPASVSPPAVSSSSRKPPFSLAGIHVSSESQPSSHESSIAGEDAFPASPNFKHGGSYAAHPPLSNSTSPATSFSQRSIYTSNNTRIKFVSSYQMAVNTCMKQSQLLKRDPKLIGKLLSYFITTFISKYWITSLIVIGAILSIELTNHRWIFAYTPAVLGAWLVVKLILLRYRLTTELSPGVPMHSFQFFKHSRVISRSRALPVARLYSSSGCGPSAPGTPGGLTSSGSSTPNGTHSTGHHTSGDIFFQPSEGYCGQATLNNVLASIPMQTPAGQILQRKFFVCLPMVVRPFSLTEMEKYMLECVSASSILASTIEKIEIMYDWEKNPTGIPGGCSSSDKALMDSPTSIGAGGDRTPGYTNFLSTLAREVNDPRYRFMANFLRTPLFFCAEDKTATAAASPSAASSTTTQATPSSVSLGRKLFSGHWSPILGWLDGSDVERVMWRGSVTPQTAGTPNTNHTLPGGFPSPGTSKWPRSFATTTQSPQRTPRLHPVSMLPSIPSSGVDPASNASIFGLTESQAAGEALAAAPADPTPVVSSGLRCRSTGNSSGSIVPLAAAGSGPLSGTSTPTTTTARGDGTPATPGQGRATSDAALHYANYLSATAAACVACHPTERQAISDGLLLIADVNPTYGHYCVPPRRMYDAVQTVNLLDAGPRGLIRITLKQSPMNF